MNKTFPTITRFLSFFVCILVIALACKKDNNTPPPASDVHLNNGLLVYLPFKGNFADSSGNGNPTAAVGGAALSYDEHGYAGRAFEGNGSTARILVTNNGSIKFDTAFTISINGMIKNQQRQAFATMADNTTALGVSFGFGPGLPGLNNVDFSVCDTVATCSSPTNASNNFVDTTQFTLDPYAWYNMIAAYHKGVMKVYANGQLVSTYSAVGTKAFLCPSSKVIIGGWWDNDPSGLSGKVSEFRLYNRVLNADEIAQLAKNFQLGN